MKTSMEIYKLENGYFFNEESGKLEAYALDEVLANFGCDCADYRCYNVGGCEAVTLLGSQVCGNLYKTEEDFRMGKPVQAERVNFCDAFCAATYIDNHVGGVTPMRADDDRFYAIAWDGKSAARQCVNDTWLSWCPQKGWRKTGYDTARYYRCMEDVYAANDYIVKQADGTEVVRKSPKSLLALTDEQRKVVEQISILLNRARELNVQIIVDDCCSTGIFAYNTAHVDNVDLWEENDGHIEAMNLVERFYSGNVWAVNEIQYLQVKFKDEVPGVE